jgi:tryptophan synthase beta chain
MQQATKTSIQGYFGEYGGQFVPETLIPALEALSDAYAALESDSEFHQQLDQALHHFVGRATPLSYAPRLSEHYGLKIYLKREDLCHTGAHKINNAIGQALLAKKMGKTKIIAETGAGQHGVATATACAKYGLECIVYMGEEDVKRQRLNVERMQLMGSEVRPVTSGTRTLKDATSEAIRHWVTHVEECFYIIGSVVGPHPYPLMTRNFHRVIGLETRQQVLAAEGRLPDALVACVGGGSNAAGFFHPFIDDKDVAMFGVEAAGYGVESHKTAATLSKGKPGVLHGSLSYLLQDDNGQVDLAHSISAGLDYPGVGPEHSYWKDEGRVGYSAATDQEAMRALETCAALEGIIPALETAHAFAWLDKQQTVKDGSLVVINCSGRGDKDMEMITEYRATARGIS